MEYIPVHNLPVLLAYAAVASVVIKGLTGWLNVTNSITKKLMALVGALYIVLAVLEHESVYITVINTFLVAFGSMTGAYDITKIIAGGVSRLITAKENQNGFITGGQTEYPDPDEFDEVDDEMQPEEFDTPPEEDSDYEIVKEEV